MAGSDRHASHLDDVTAFLVELLDRVGEEDACAPKLTAALVAAIGPGEAMTALRQAGISPVG